MDSNGYLIEPKVISFLDGFYTDESLKAAVKSVAPECVAEANVTAKGEQDLYSQQISCHVN